KNSKNPEAAWQFIKYLTTNTDAVVKLANGIKNIPTLDSALKSSALKVDDKFKVFIDISSNGKTSTTPPSGSGSAYQQAMQKFCQVWQAGSVKDLGGGLKKLDTDINQQLALGGLSWQAPWRPVTERRALVPFGRAGTAPYEVIP